MTVAQLDKPSIVLRRYLEQEDALNWTIEDWHQHYAVPLAEGGQRSAFCRCQGGILVDYAEDHVPQQEGEDEDQYLCRAYGLTPELRDAAIRANDGLDDEDLQALYPDPNVDTQPGWKYWVLQALAPKYLRRVIAVYEEAGK